MNLTQKRNDRTEHAFTDEWLSAYLDGELTSRETMRVEHHLARCPDCQWSLKTLRATVQWTRQLPVVAVPRAFTVPVPARPVRAAPRIWGGLPVLQGATALVALLFLVAVVGELFLPRLFPASAPQREMAVEHVPVVEATQVVELEALPPGLTGTPAPASALAEPPLAPQPTVAAAAKALQVADTPAPEAGAMQATGLGGASDQAAYSATQVIEMPVVAAAPPAPLTGTAEIASAAPAAPRGLPLPSPTVEAPAAVEVSTTVADLQEKGQPSPDQSLTMKEEQAGVRRAPFAGWLGRVVIALGVAFVLLGTITIVAMVRRLRA